MVHLCMLLVVVRLNFQSSSKFDYSKSTFWLLTVLSDVHGLHSALCVKQQRPRVQSVNKDKYSIKSKIINKVNLRSKLITNLFFSKKLTLIDRKITRSRNYTSIFVHMHTIQYYIVQYIVYCNGNAICKDLGSCPTSDQWSFSPVTRFLHLTTKPQR